MPRDEFDVKSWLERPAVIFAAGIAALLLILFLIIAVVRTSEGPSGPPDYVAPSSSGSAGPWTPSSSTATSYTLPSVQTSEQNLPPPVPAPAPAGTPTDDASDTESPTPTTWTTIFNPYVTTTPPLAGHV